MLIKNSVTRVTFRHHEACRMTEFSICAEEPLRIPFLRQLHLDLNICCFINFTLEKLHFSIKKLGTLHLLYVDVETFWGNWRHAREWSYTPHVRRHFLATVGFTEMPVGHARKGFPRFSPLLTNLILPRGIDKRRIATGVVNTLAVYCRRSRNSFVKTLGVDVIVTSHKTSTFNVADVNV